MTTLQAVSGAGYPGVPALDILGNVIPYIGEEEEKVERELPKLLGGWDGSTFQPAPFAVSAQTNRVAGRARSPGLPVGEVSLARDSRPGA